LSFASKLSPYDAKPAPPEVRLLADALSYSVYLRTRSGAAPLPFAVVFLLILSEFYLSLAFESLFALT